MAIAFDQNLGTATDPALASTIALTTAQTVAVGGKIFVDVANFDASFQLSSVAGGGLTWNVDLKASNGSQRYGRASADAPAGLASGTVITATLTGGSSDKSISAFSVTGVASGTTYDGTNSSTAGGGATWSGGAVTTANANDIIVGGGTEDGSGTATTTPSGGYTEVNDFNNGTSLEAWESVYQIVSATGTYTPGGTFSASGTVSVGLAVAYKAAAGVATDSSPPATGLPVTFGLARSPFVGQTFDQTPTQTSFDTGAPPVPAPMRQGIFGAFIGQETPNAIGSPQAGVRAVSPDTGINATSSMSGSVRKLAAITPAAINSTSNVTAAVSKLARITPASISSTSAVSGAVSKLAAILPTSISSTSTISGAVVKLAQIRGASITATSPVTATVTGGSAAITTRDQDRNAVFVVTNY